MKKNNQYQKQWNQLVNERIEFQEIKNKLLSVRVNKNGFKKNQALSYAQQHFPSLLRLYGKNFLNNNNKEGDNYASNNN